LADLLREVRRTIKWHDLLTGGAGVVVGVSGGADSLCLLHLLTRLRSEFALQLHVAHLHHGARGAEADADADFVADLASRWNLPSTIERQDVPQIARQHRLAFEEAARRVRYSFLARVAHDVGAGKIAVGHNADDQAETVLMHLLRGSGPAGLRGMLPLRRLADYRLIEKPPTPLATCLQLIRPLLGITRQEIESYCAEQDLDPRFDRSNLDTTYLRNRLRHELLPALESYNPNIRRRLCNTAQVIAADYELLADLGEKAWTDVVQSEDEEVIVFDLVCWLKLPAGLQRATLRQAAYRLRKSLRDVNFCHVENARQLALRGETGTQATLPQGLALTVGYKTLTVRDAGSSSPPPDEPLLWDDEPIDVSIPGTTLLPESVWLLRAERLAAWDPAEIAATADPWQAHLDEDTLPLPLVLRPRRRGERLKPLGMDGHTVRLSSLMINLKIPAAWRDRVPLLAASDQVVWVCGRRIAHGFAVRPNSRRIVRLSFERVP